MRDLEVIDSELRLLAAVRRLCREQDGILPSIGPLDELLDETLGRYGSHSPRQDGILQRHEHREGAPIEVSSGDVVRHRLSRAGDRQLNFCLHLIAIAQVRHHTLARDYLRNRSEGKNHKEAMRCLKRSLSNVVYQQMRRDAQQPKADPGGHLGAALSSRATG